MNNVESDIAQVFESWGFQCTRIKEGSDKRPDFFLSDEHERYYIELKTKYESPERSRIRQDRLRPGQIYMDSLGLRATAAYRSILKKAYEQLTTSSYCESEPLRIPWLLCLGQQASTDVKRFTNMLFGTAYVADFSDDGEARPCHYFYESLFFKYRDSIDAAIVSTESQISICLNSYSPRYSRAKSCGLTGILASGLRDPCSLEKAGEAWIADMIGDRKNVSVTLNAVVKKYGLSQLTRVIEMEDLTASILIDAI